MTMTTMSAESGFELGLSADDALPLFTAQGERRWVPGWEPEMVGDGGPGSAFVTRMNGTETSWVVIDYDVARGIARYARWVAGVQAGLVEVRCAPLAADRCAVRVRYALTPLSPESVAAVAGFLEPDRFAGSIAGWKRLIVEAGLAAD
ncbi:MAG TPA: hypothetical protein VLF18_20475 [Tahibacter sp.]|uniref:hypothetical protein n=1 Tax=Tahibacter sp. TaxID=2056211 RepID=UPI002B94A57E|nr:hypothetical protein [Tahibacter sp.]HSX62566.1 hypothetical protein [Tahibacter sp.]